ncbi:LacI family DNA-binding transcriptional regulator [Streptomyces siamensis]|uniref:LacI family DNA-binding transcriptional regulator n=1 Tax=Streptomyces siamensis TaxID=1274986 RepID=A0ABP9IPJ4_9ACTN
MEGGTEGGDVAGARMKDVAARAGVSIKTVSNVVRGAAKVAEPTRLRVERAIAELDYRPHASARHLRTGRSGIIALAFPELVAPYFAELAAEVVVAAKEHGYTVLIEDTGGDPDEELRIASGLTDSLIDGVLLSPLRLDQARLAALEQTVPLVLLGERSYDIAADHVLIDNAAAAREATEHLLALGRRRIAVIGHQTDPPFATSAQRMHGYFTALHAAGVPYDPRLAPPVRSFGRAEGAEAMSRLLDLDHRPDAVFCFSDLLASGALRVAHERHVEVPHDMAVVGFDDLEESRYAVPSLTTVSPDKREIARMAVAALLDRMSDEPATRPTTLTAGHRLVVRESSAGRPCTPAGPGTGDA